MYLAAGEFVKAIEIMGQNGWVERYKKLNTCIILCVKHNNYKPHIIMQYTTMIIES